MGTRYYEGYSTSSDDDTEGDEKLKELEREKEKQNLLNDDNISKEVRQEL